jgi:hypothetical protein
VIPARALLASVALALAAACAGAGGARPPPPGTDERAAREVLRRFARALEDGRFEEAHALLSARWRAATTPARLALDWRGAGAGAREAAARVLARLEAGDALERTGAAARLGLGQGRAALVVAEPAGWRVDALE